MLLPAFAIGTSLLGTAMSMAGQLQQGKAADAAAQYNAAVTEAEGLQRSKLIRKRGRRSLGSMRTAIAKAGVTTEGSPMEAIAESAANIEIDALNAVYSSQSEAAMTRLEGRQARKASRIGAAATLLSGASNAAQTGYNLGMFS